MSLDVFPMSSQFLDSFNENLVLKFSSQPAVDAEGNCSPSYGHRSLTYLVFTPL